MSEDSPQSGSRATPDADEPHAHLAGVPGGAARESLRHRHFPTLRTHAVPALPTLDCGDGPTVVLFPGFSLSSRTYRETVELLATHNRVIVPHTFEAAEGWTREPLLDRIEATLDEAGVHRFTVVGHSFGGALALGFAARRPHRLNAVVFVDSEALSHRWALARDAVLGARLRWLPSVASVGDFTLNWMRHPAQMVKSALWGWWADHDEEIETVRRTTVPRHVLWAERDTVPSRPLGEAFAERLDAAFHIVRSGPGEEPLTHNWPFLRPERFAVELRRIGVVRRPQDDA